MQIRLANPSIYGTLLLSLLTLIILTPLRPAQAQALQNKYLTPELRGAMLTKTNNKAFEIFRSIVRADLATSDEFSLQERKEGCSLERKFRNMGGFLACTTLGIEQLREKLKYDLIRAQDESVRDLCGMVRLSLQKWPHWKNLQAAWKHYECEKIVFHE